jgi:phage gpG-like protein
MPDKINIKIDSTLLREKIETLQKRVDNAGPAFAAIAQVMASSVEKNFEVQGRYSEPGSWKGGNSKWKALSPWTLFSAIGGNRGYTKGGVTSGRLRTRAQRKLASKKILQDSGQLAASITPHSNRSSAVLSTNKVYAAIQNFGGQAGRGKKVTIPARPYMVIQDEDIQDAIWIIEGFLLKGVK